MLQADAKQPRPSYRKVCDAPPYGADVAQQTALLLISWNRIEEALQILGGALKADPDNPDLMLSQAIILALMERTQDAEHTLIQIESRWPEWDRAYAAHGLLLESTGRTSEARRKLQMAIVLGSKEVVTKCALARLGRESGRDARCACVTGLRRSRGSRMPMMPFCTPCRCWLHN